MCCRTLSALCWTAMKSFARWMRCLTVDLIASHWPHVDWIRSTSPALTASESTRSFDVNLSTSNSPSRRCKYIKQSSSNDQQCNFTNAGARLSNSLPPDIVTCDTVLSRTRNISIYAVLQLLFCFSFSCRGHPCAFYLGYVKNPLCNVVYCNQRVKRFWLSVAPKNI